MIRTRTSTSIGIALLAAALVTACSSSLAAPTATTAPASTTTPPTALPTTPATTPSTPASSPAADVANPLPAPTGALAVGVVDLPRSGATAYYPAIAGTGHGNRPYASPALLGLYGVSADAFSAIVPSAQIMATPLLDGTARPVVILAPGGGSFIELSTSLAEDLASHGYVVITVQPDIAVDGSLHVGDGDYSEAEQALSEQIGDELRVTQIDDAIELLEEPLVTELIGPVDTQRIALGGHSYGGSTAFNVALDDPRISAVFDLDGTLFGDAGTTPVTVPSLVVMAEMLSIALDPPAVGGDPQLTAILDAEAAAVELIRTAPNTVSVGLLNAIHYSVTDLPAILPGLPESVRTDLEDSADQLGRAGTINTNTIVLRFLDAALTGDPRLPTAAELVDGLPGTTADPMALVD